MINRVAVLASCVFCAGSLLAGDITPVNLDPPAQPATQPATAPGGQSPPTAWARSESLQVAWAELASEEPLKAYQAACTLAKAGQAGVAFMANQIPLVGSKPAQAMKLISQLDSDSYQVRKQAGDTLSSLGGTVERELRRDLESPATSAEARQQIKDMLAQIERTDSPSSDVRQQIMAVCALEMMDSPAARDLLAKLAQGAPRSASQARAALDRLCATQPAVEMAGKTVLLVQWQAVLPRETVWRILPHSKAFETGSEDFVGLQCDAATLRQAVKRFLPGSEAREQAGTVSPVEIRRTGGSGLGVLIQWEQSVRFGVDQRGRPIQSISRLDIHLFASCRLAVSDGVGRLEMAGRDAEIKVFSEPKHQVTLQKPSPPKFKGIVCPVGKAICLVAATPPQADCQPHMLIVFEAVAVPTRLAPFFRGGARWLRDGQAAMEKLAEEGLAWNVLAEAQKDKVNPNWVRTLGDGTQVRLARVSLPDYHPYKAWDGDGNPVICEAGGGEGPVVCVAFEIRAGEKDTWRSFFGTIFIGRDLEIGLGDGTWQNIQTLKPDEQVTVGSRPFTLKDIRPMSGKDPLQKGKTMVTLIHRLDTEAVWAVGAIDKAGNLISSGNVTDVTDRIDFMAIREVPPYDNNVPAILNVDLSDVDHYVLLKRPRTWVNFKGFALQPKGSATSAPAGTNPAIHPATTPAMDSATQPAAVQRSRT